MALVQETWLSNGAGVGAGELREVTRRNGASVFDLVVRLIIYN